MTVGEVMTREVISFRPEDPLEEVARAVAEKGISGFPVVDRSRRVVGVITEGDLIRRYRAVRIPPFIDLLGGVFPLGSLSEVEEAIREMASTRVEEIMARSPVTVRPEWPVERAAELMWRHRIKRLPVVDEEGRLVGIVSRADLVRALMVRGDNGEQG